MEKTCARCKTKVPLRAKFCKRCGSSDFLGTKICENCKTLLPDKEINFCPVCGRRISSSTSTKQRAIIAPEGKTHKCGICMQEITIDLIFCPNCINAFHFNHISSWIVEKKQCPICKTKLEFG